jgi:hypothetical protein
MQSPAETVDQYLASLSAERRRVLSEVRDVVRRNLPKGFEESMRGGAITYEVPLARYPKTYNTKPLSYAALAAQKNYYALYLMSVYGDPGRERSFRSAFEKAGKKLDMGKSCVRFKRLEDLPLDVIGQTIASMTPDEYIAKYEASRSR